VNFGGVAISVESVIAISEIEEGSMECATHYERWGAGVEYHFQEIS